ARLNLEYSTVHAPCDGVITNLQLREGDFAHVGEAVLSCVDRGQWMVVANYRERSLERLRPGQRALVTFRAAPGRIYGARVFALGWGGNQGQPTNRGFQACGVGSLIGEGGWRSWSCAATLGRGAPIARR